MRRGRFSWLALTALLVGWAFARSPTVASRPHPEPGGRSGTRPKGPPRENTPAPLPPLPSSSAGATAGASLRQDAFSSAAACTESLRAGHRLPRGAGTTRFASWNLHWFPDGVPRENGAPVDVTWLACAVSWLDADVVAVQEVKESPRAQQALATLLAELNRWLGARYVAHLDDCGRRVTQHVGLIWNEARVTARDVETIAALNPHGGACDGQLRPGLAARFRSPGGLDLEVVSAHFKSMADQRAFELRQASFAAVPGVLRALTQAAHDDDFLLLGDLNTMGCDDCTPAVSSRQEVADVERRLLSGGVRVVPADAAGTELYEGHLTLLDHALGATAMRELPAGARSHVVGACAAGAPTLTNRAAKNLRRGLSDHCPLVLDLLDRDLD